MDELEAMLGKPDWKPSKEKRRMPKGTRNSPDALVLICSVITCNCCGEKFVTPNKYLMLRFGESLIGIRTGRAEYDSLPREVQKFEEEVSACLQCFIADLLVRRN